MKKYSKVVSEMYSPCELGEAHPMERYIGRLARCCNGQLEVVVGYSRNDLPYDPLLIVDASQTDGWSTLEPFDVVFKECERYWYVSINNLID